MRRYCQRRISEGRGKSGADGSKAELRLRQTALKRKENQIGAAANAKFAEQIGDVKFHGALGDVEFAGDFLVRKIFEERVQDFLLAAAEVGDGICFEAASLTGQDGIDEAGKNRARDPESTIGDERQSAGQLFARLGVGEETLNSETQELIAVGVRVLLADDDKASFGMAFEKIGQESASCGTGGMPIDHVHLPGRRLKTAHIGSERGFKLLDDDLEWSLPQNAFEFAQHEWVRRKDADRQLGTCTFGSHYVPAY